MNESTDTPRKMGITMLMLAWAVLFGLMALFFDDWLGEQQNPNQIPVSRFADGAKEVVLLPNRQHHYVVNGSINDQPVVFLLDTGATDVVVPQQLAQWLGLSSGRKHYVTTANGTVAVYSTQLKTVQIGAIRLRDISASINPGMDNDVVLLGMSALHQIEFTQRGDTLILRQ
ncbi:MAG: TIGR02281 family clan AA aspartic protease [Pseudomonadales bacterium]